MSSQKTGVLLLQRKKQQAMGQSYLTAVGESNPCGDTLSCAPCQHAGNGFHKQLLLSAINTTEHFLLSDMKGEVAASSRPSKDGLHKPYAYQPCLGFTSIALRQP